ncbi:7877_t:CDS:2 [Scutellospora calospora]|uniref:7877_t:CDS:1 n=1 Tax=Scutellospora calospora TaxID=85575 RepID=A0ACA9K8P8_9GLOM|nr:7877_t:CDS:2 [Scutellospora calospora]
MKMIQLEYLELLDILTEEQTTKAYEMIDETMKNLIEKEQSKNEENKDEIYSVHLKDTKLDEFGYEADNEDDNADPGKVDMGGTNEEEREMDELTARITQVSKIKTETPEGKDVESKSRIKRKKELKSEQDNTAWITNKKTLEKFFWHLPLTKSNFKIFDPDG